MGGFLSAWIPASILESLNTEVLAELTRIKLEGLEVNEAQRTRLMKTVARARTDSEQVVAMASVQAVADKANFKAAKTELQVAIKSIPKFGKVYGVRQAAIDKINAALEGTDLTTLSETKKAELEGIQQDLIDVGFKIEQGIENAPDEEVEGIKSVIGDNALAQLRRLGKTPLADMKPKEIQGMADAIRYAVTQNALQNKMIKGAETQDAAGWRGGCRGINQD